MMALGEDTIEEPDSEIVSTSGNGRNDAETLLILESIVQRLKPRDSHHVRDMITQRGWISGALFMASLLFWWISVKKGTEGISDSEIPLSLIGAFSFETLSVLVPSLVVLATLVMVVGREKGNANLSQIGGFLVILALFYIAEPILLNSSELGAQKALFASGRLLMIAVMVGFASRFMFDAMLLSWVRASMISMGVDVFHNGNSQSQEGHADEQQPLV
ncbi:MAG: hypothetical protein VX954_00410 [Candidatus Thermoplasmatota archaeon]|nr:hypothetical protein [Candidatus Thermoplasmatota archaeon]